MGMGVLTNSSLFLVLVALCSAHKYDTCKPPQLLGHKDDVHVYLIEDFFSKEECDSILDYRTKRVKLMSKNKPLICFNSLSTFLWYLHPKPFEGRFIEGTMCTNESQSAKLLDTSNNRPITYSSSYSIYPNEGLDTSWFTSLFDKRLESILPHIPDMQSLFSNEKGGKYQITRYEVGQGYASHTDCDINSKDKRDRAGTVLVYLEDTEFGGETSFPYFDLKIKPKKGNAILFNSMDVRTGTCQEFSKHDARPVENNTNSHNNNGSNNNKDPHSSFTTTIEDQTAISGSWPRILTTPPSKTILQRWYYYETSPNLGKRVEEPSRPIRKENTPLISCDGIGGYCRWYDEWQFTHLVDYREQFGLTNGIPSKNSFVWK